MIVIFLVMDVDVLFAACRDTTRRRDAFKVLMDGHFVCKNSQDQEALKRLVHYVQVEKTLANHQSDYHNLLNMVVQDGRLPEVNVLELLCGSPGSRSEEMYFHEIGPCKTTTPTQSTVWDRGVLNLLWTWVSKNSKFMFWFVHVPTRSKVSCGTITPGQIIAKQKMYMAVWHAFEKIKKPEDPLSTAVVLQPFMSAMCVFGPMVGTVGYIRIQVRVDHETDTISIVNIEPDMVGAMRMSELTELPAAFLRAMLVYDPTLHVILVIRNVANTDTAVFVVHKDLVTI